MAGNTAKSSDSEKELDMSLSSDSDDSSQNGVKRPIEDVASCDENAEPNKKMKESPSPGKNARKRKQPRPESEASGSASEAAEPPPAKKKAVPREPKKTRVRKSTKTSGSRKTKTSAEVPEAPKRSRSISRKRPSASQTHLDIPQVEHQTVVLASGDNETGQLGQERSSIARFIPVPDIKEKIVTCAAGGMHSLLLSEKGNVFSFGCNDEGSLGRRIEDEDDCFKVDPVSFGDVQIAKIATGSIHCVALSTDCRVFLWGSYRDNCGAFGISPQNSTFSSEPIEITLPDVVVDVACGADHTLMLTAEGTVYTMGCAEHGRLGRIRRSHCGRENRRARKVMLSPQPMLVMRKRKLIHFDRIWASRYCTFARSLSDGKIWGCGLNNCHQLGEIDPADHVDNFVYHPVELRAFDLQKEWVQICGGEQHTLALDSEGTVYSMGRGLYGRLGLGPADSDDPDVTKLTPVPGLENRVVGIAAGDHCSFAIDKDGQLLCWGQGSNMLGQGDREAAEETDLFVPTPCASKHLKDKTVIHVSAGSNHTLCVRSE